MTQAVQSDTELRRFARLAAPMLQGVAAGGYGPRAAQNQPGQGLEYLDTRHYEPGDDVRGIDWRQSARRNTLVIRRYRDETAADWYICLDCSASVGWGGRKWPLTVQLATALSYTMLYAGHRVGLLFFSDRINGLCELGRGARHFSTLAASLYSHQPVAPARGKTDDPGKTSNLGLCGPRLARNSNVFILSDFLEPDVMRDDLKSIRMRAVATSAIQVLDADETRVPARGMAALRDAESGETHNVEMSDQTGPHATDVLGHHNELLHDNCAALGLRITSCDTTQHWQSVLLDHLRT